VYEFPVSLSTFDKRQQKCPMLRLDPVQTIDNYSKVGYNFFMLEKIKKHKFAIFVVVLISLNLIILFLGRQFSSRNVEQSLLYDQKIQDFSVTDIDGKRIDIDDSGNRWKVLYFSSLSKNEEIRRVRYLNIIRHKIDEPDLLIMGVFRMYKPDLLEFRDQKKLSIRVVNQFENPGLKEVLPSSRKSSLLVILDPMNRVKFISKFFLENDIKQLVEKFVHGKVSYAPMEASQVSLEGSTFPIIQVKDLRNGNLEDFPPARNIVAVVFTGRCPTCVLSKFKTSYPTLEAFFSRRNIEMSYLFSSKFLESEISETFNDSNAAQFLAVDYIPLVEDYYDSVFHTDEQILAVSIGSRGEIIYFDSLEKYIETHSDNGNEEEK
jgi:hypothetical protein